MLLCLLTLAMMDGGAVWEIDQTEIYEPIGRRGAAVSPTGELYLLDYAEFRVLHYDADGNKLGSFGRKGQGPGEFTFPVSIHFDDDKLYVFDMGGSAIHVFQSDGAFLSRYSLPSMGVEAARVDNGWITGNWMFSRDPAAPVEVLWRDETLEQQEPILEWPRDAEGGGMRIMAGPNAPAMPFNPVRDRPAMAASPDGKLVFLSHPGPFKISVIDAEKKRVVRTIQRDLPQIPFNEQWGDQRLKESEERSKSRGGMAIKFKPDYPKYFPNVRSLLATADGRLAVERWSGEPDARDLFLVMTPDGKDASLPYDPKYESRILAVRDGKAYVTTFADDEAGVALCEMSQLPAFFESNPIEYDGSGARFFIRAN